MRIPIARVLLLSTAALSAALWSGCSGDGDDPPTPTDEQRVIAVFNEQLEHFRAGDFDALYANYSPAFREQCTQEALVASIEAAGVEPDRLEFEDVKAVIEGDRARLTYRTLYDEQPLAIVDDGDPDVYIRVEGNWYDELDPHTHC